jgi:4-hydroxy-tetrahydrodipicolinate synthase
VPVSPLQPGVWGVIATPFRQPTLELDHGSLAREIEHYVAIGATGVVVLGVFGEAASLDTAERATVIRTATSAAAGLPIVVGATSLATRPAIEEAARASDIAGSALAAVMLQVNSTSSDVLAAHLQAVHDATGIGIVVQHYPEAGGKAIATSGLVAAINAVPAVVAAKCEQAPTVVEIAAIAAQTQVPAFGGLGGTGLLDELAAGSAGAMTGFSCPEGLLACVAAFRAGGVAAAREAWAPYLPLANFEFQRGVALAIRKEALCRRGLIDDAAVRPPAAALPAVFAVQLGAHLDHALQPVSAG